MKKLFSVILCFAVLLNIFALNAFAANEAKGASPAVKAKAAVLMEQGTGKVLYEKNSDQKLYPASVTKIMTMLLVAEAIDDGKISFSDKVAASKEAAAKGGSQIWLKEGETMTVDELFKAMSVYSANDACTALAEHVAGSEDGFINMMNERAAQLGMKNTHFENCTGLDDTAENHLTTAYDIALMARALMGHEFVKKYTTIWMDSLRNGATELVNTNKLVRFYSGCTGLKTGTTAKAGCCVCATATRDNTSLIAVVLGSDNSTDRFESAKAMLNYGFANYGVTQFGEKGSEIRSVAVESGKSDSVMTAAKESSSALLQKSQIKKAKIHINLPKKVKAPVKKGSALGEIIITLDGETISRTDIVASHSVGKKDCADYMFGFFRRMVLA